MAYLFLADRKEVDFGKILLVDLSHKYCQSIHLSFLLVQYESEFRFRSHRPMRNVLVYQIVSAATKISTCPWQPTPVR